MHKTKGLVRGCARRKVGALYLMTKVQDFSVPWQHFLFDPPQMLPVGFNLSHQGVDLQPRQHKGSIVYDIYDYMGAGAAPNPVSGYWNFTDYLYEGINFSFSTLVPRREELIAKITRQSRLIKVFPHGLIENAEPFCETPVFGCPKNQQLYAPGLHHDGHCVGLLWDAVEGGFPTGNGREILRKMPAFQYQAWQAPGETQTVWQQAMVMWLPPTGWEVIEDTEEQTHQQALDILKGRTNLPYVVVEE